MSERIQLAWCMAEIERLAGECGRLAVEKAEARRLEERDMGRIERLKRRVAELERERDEAA